MKKLAYLFCLVPAISLTLSGIVMAAGKPSEKSAKKVTAEIVSVDLMARTITLKDDKSESKTATAVKKAATYIRNLKPGDKAVLTCEQNDNGEILNVSNFKVIKK